MREIRTSGLMSGEGKRSDANTAQATAPFLDSTGKACLADALTTEPAQKLAAVLDKHFPRFTSQLTDTFNSWLIHFEQETYITCLTEQLANEEQMGRLSMWRAYGAGANPVAFVVNSGPFLRPSDALNAHTSPVAYLSKERFREEYARVAANIIDNIDFLETLGRDNIFAHLFAAYRYSVVCTKHPSFHEEREWRIIYQPTFLRSHRLLEDRVTINGNPQRIYKIPLLDVPEEGFYGATLPDLFCKLLIGPSPTAPQLRREFIHMLEEQGVQGAAAKVEISDVPLRVS
jgi:hypothetical protein